MGEDLRAPTHEQRAATFRSDDGREVTFGLLYDAVRFLAASSWNETERYYVMRRLAEQIGVNLVPADR